MCFQFTSSAPGIRISFTTLQLYSSIEKTEPKLFFVLGLMTTLCKKCPYLEIFWSVCFHIRTEYGPEKLQIQTLFMQCQWLRKMTLQQILVWGAWESWRECSETYGSYGKRERVRYCINPVPTNGGREYRGYSSETEPCNRELCPSNSFCSSVTPKFM